MQEGRAAALIITFSFPKLSWRKKETPHLLTTVASGNLQAKSETVPQPSPGQWSPISALFTALFQEMLQVHNSEATSNIPAQNCTTSTNPFSIQTPSCSDGGV
uniref:Uncharacterized protein n=1 Tax=Knipowitschia caucasica TaxID=637954 RepID=A0AAV2K5H2_KNICA